MQIKYYCSNQIMCVGHCFIEPCQLTKSYLEKALATFFKPKKIKSLINLILNYIITIIKVNFDKVYSME